MARPAASSRPAPAAPGLAASGGGDDRPSAGGAAWPAAVARFRVDSVNCTLLCSDALDGDAGRADLDVVGACRIAGREYLVVTAAAAAAELPRREAVALLTQRELQVATMVCEGQCNKRIADRLHLSEWTVSSYLRRIYGKLGVHTRAAMAARVIASRPPGR